MAKVAVAADLHFGRGDERGIAQYRRSFEEMITGMVSRNINLAVFAGDIFDRYHTFNADSFTIFASGINRLIAAGAHVAVLSGGHDYRNDGANAVRALRPVAGMDCFIEPAMMPYNDIGVFLVAVPWITRAAIKANPENYRLNAEQVAEKTFTDIVAPFLADAKAAVDNARSLGMLTVMSFHATLIGGELGNEAYITPTDFTIDPAAMVATGVDHIAGGHFHRRQDVRGAWYVGSMERNTYGEAGNPTGWMLIEDQGRTFVELESSASFQTVKVEVGQSVEDQKFSGNVRVVVKLDHKTSVDLVAMKEGIEKGGADSVKIVTEYVDAAEMVRSKDIRSDYSESDLFAAWREASGKDGDGRLQRLYDFESLQGFVAVPDREYFDSAAAAMMAITE